MGRPDAVASAFNAADSYENRALLQARVAQQLATRLAEWQLPRSGRILEIGCGTGFLGRALIRNWPQGTFFMTDVAPAMVRRCQKQLEAFTAVNKYFAVMNGEMPAMAHGFDLIVSSLVFQWFQDPLASLERLVALLAPGGRLAFATLGPNTFREWRLLCQTHQIPCGLHNYPEPIYWQDGWPEHGQGQVFEETKIEIHTTSLDFLRSLKEIGAHTPKQGHRPINAGDLRRVIREVHEDDQGFTVTYHVLYGIFDKNHG